MADATMEWEFGRNKNACPDCGGNFVRSGRCSACQGSGQDARLNSADSICRVCGGDGLCRSCSGTGQKSWTDGDLGGRAQRRNYFFVAAIFVVGGLFMRSWLFSPPMLAFAAFCLFQSVTWSHYRGHK
jgi:hypothetical protein